METTEKVRQLNDIFRSTLIGGKILLTTGVAELQPELVKELLKQISEYQDFNKDNDPYCEHDFGALKLSVHKFFFKIDYYDKSYKYGSEDPTDPNVTARVMTVMLAEEY